VLVFFVSSPSYQTLPSPSCAYRSSVSCVRRQLSAEWLVPFTPTAEMPRVSLRWVVRRQLDAFVFAVDDSVVYPTGSLLQGEVGVVDHVHQVGRIEPGRRVRAAGSTKGARMSRQGKVIAGATTMTLAVVSGTALAGDGGDDDGDDGRLPEVCQERPRQTTALRYDGKTDAPEGGCVTAAVGSSVTAQGAPVRRRPVDRGRARTHRGPGTARR
jgi:hypothetical protein